MKNIDKRIIDKGFHTDYEVDYVTIQKSDYEYLKEQAVRVQEYEYTQKYEDKLIKQNKRYREALDYIRNWKSKPHEKYINHLKAVADDALEGEE